MSVPHVEQWELTRGFDEDAPMWRWSRTYRSIEDVEVPGVNDPLPRCSDRCLAPRYHTFQIGCVHRRRDDERDWMYARYTYV